MEILRAYDVELKGARAVVIGRSNIVGKPMALLLLAEHATVTIAHSRTRDLDEVAREADVLVAAVGRRGTVTAAMVKPGATVIDVGINRVDGKVRGDVGRRRVRRRGAPDARPGRGRPDDDRRPFAQHGSCRSLPVGRACLPPGLGATVANSCSQDGGFSAVVRL